MRETVFQRRCLNWVRTQHKGKLLAVNIHGGGYSNKGFPDVLIFGGGKTVAVELKSDTSGYKLQPDQALWRERFKAVSIPHYIIHTFDEFLLMLETEFGYEQNNKLPADQT